MAGCRRVGGDGGGPDGVRERRVFVCQLGRDGRELGQHAGQHQRGGGAGDESGVAGGGSFGGRAIRVGVREFYVGLGVPLPLDECGGVMDVDQYRNQQRHVSNHESRVAGCGDVGEREIPGGVCGGRWWWWWRRWRWRWRIGINGFIVDRECDTVAVEYRETDVWVRVDATRSGYRRRGGGRPERVFGEFVGGWHGGRHRGADELWRKWAGEWTGARVCVEWFECVDTTGGGY